MGHLVINDTINMLAYKVTTMQMINRITFQPLSKQLSVGNLTESENPSL